MADLGDSGELLGYLTAFWKFAFKPTYRSAKLAAWRGAAWPRRSLMVVEAAFATVVGLVVPLELAFLVFTLISG